jgi:hypothetical protein
MRTPLKRIQICIAVQQQTNLRDLQKATGMSVSEHIRRAIDQYLAKQRKNK